MRVMAVMNVANRSLTGGCSDVDLKTVVEEQENSRGDFPGPMPVIIRYILTMVVVMGGAATPKLFQWA